MSVVVANRDELKQRIQHLLAADLAAVNDLLQRQFRNPNMFVQDVAEHVSRFQGKQIRPILVLLSAAFSPNGRGTGKCASPCCSGGNDPHRDAGA